MLCTKFFSIRNSPKVVSHMTCFLQSRSLTKSDGDAHPSMPKAEVVDGLAIKEKATSGEKKDSSPKLSRPPFIKNLFHGVFDSAILAYAEIKEKGRYEKLEEFLAPLKNFMERVDKEEIHTTGQISSEVQQRLRKLGVYGLQIPEDFGGLDLRKMEYLKIVEVLAGDHSISNTVLAHQTLGTAGLLLAGNDEQRNKYLPRLASGEWEMTLCMINSKAALNQTGRKLVAKKQPEGHGYHLYGSTQSVVLGATADLFLVLGCVMTHNRPFVEDIAELKLFLVERTFGGISVKQEGEDSLISEVSFDGTFVPQENVLAKDKSAAHTLEVLLESRTLFLGSLHTGFLKALLKMTVRHVATCKKFGNLLAEFALVKERLARVVFDIYVIESMTYLMAGFLDSYPEQDCLLESAALKIFSTEKLWEHTNTCLQILGGQKFISAAPLQRILRDLSISQATDGTSIWNSVFIGLAGLQHSIQLHKEEFKSQRVIDRPYFYFKSIHEYLFNLKQNPKLDLLLHETLHPNLKDSSDKLEKCVKRFGIATEALIRRQGMEEIFTPSQQWCVKRVTDIAIDLYAMAAVLGRASRAYCIGIHNSEQEIRIAEFFSTEAAERITKNLDYVVSPFVNREEALQNIFDSLLQKREYSIQHPLFTKF